MTGLTRDNVRAGRPRRIPGRGRQLVTWTPESANVPGMLSLRGTIRGRPATVLLSMLLAWSVEPPSLSAQEPTSHRSSGKIDPPRAVNVVELTAGQIRADYAAGRYTTAELVGAYLDRIARYEEGYNAFISLNPRVLATAEALDEEYRTVGPRGPLHGVPVVIKDNLDMAGMVTTVGYWGFNTAAGGVDMIPDDDAAAVERLREAGAVILGKTNLPDFAGHGTRTRSTVAGLTLNPYDTTRVPGGSSGGTATAVNASFAVLGLGTETGGSIQNPASAQALVGVKPTYGLVPLEGAFPMSGTYVDVVGPLTRTVMDAALVLDVIAGPTLEDPATYAAEGHIPAEGYAATLSDSSLRGKRFGLVGPGWRSSFLPLAPETEVLYREAVAVLRARGARVVADPFRDSGFRELYREQPRVGTGAYDRHVYFRGLGPGASFHSVEEWERLTGRRFRSGPKEEAEPERRSNREGRASRGPVRPSATEEGDAFQAWRMQIRALFRRVMEEHELDGLFFPQAGAPIPPMVEDPARPEYRPNNHPELPSNIVNAMGLPTVTLPFAYYDDGTPFALAFIGDLWSEADILSWAYDLEQAARTRRPPELVR